MNVGSNASLLTNISTQSFLMPPSNSVNLTPSSPASVSMQSFDIQALKPPPQPLTASTISLDGSTASMASLVSSSANPQSTQSPPVSTTFASTFANVPPASTGQQNITNPAASQQQAPQSAPQYNLPTTAHLFNPAAFGGAGVAAFNPTTAAAPNAPATTVNYFNPASLTLPPTNLFQQLNLNEKVILFVLSIDFLF